MSEPSQPPRGHGGFGRLLEGERAVPRATPIPSPVDEPIAGGPPLGPTVIVPGEPRAGFFGRMFPGLLPFDGRDGDLALLAHEMQDQDFRSSTGDNPNVTAGYTYLGQFIDHDITLDMTPLSEQIVDPKMVRNFRTPGLDLDSLYGGGLGPHRFLYRLDRPQFVIGRADPPRGADGKTIGELPNDLPRTPDGVALIADHRNDENLIIAQMHLAFLKFHNKVVDLVIAEGRTPGPQVFREASQRVRWHYQWLVLHDFVTRVTAPGTVDAVFAGGRQFYQFGAQPFMPLEFAGAAFRFGHSMVRAEYSYNRLFRPAAARQAPLSRLFENTGVSGKIGPGGRSRLRSNWVIDWRRFFDFHTPSTTPTFGLNRARKCGPLLNPVMQRLPGFPSVLEASLPYRNLTRGCQLGLPTGQAVAEHMARRLPSLTPLTPDQISRGRDGKEAARLGLHIETPLWYYILKEAEVAGDGGRHLGPIGSRIVAEVFVGLLQGDEDSFLSEPGWTPTLPAKTPGTFLMTDLLELVGDVSPLDGITTTGTL